MKELNIRNFNKLYKDISDLGSEHLKAHTVDKNNVISYSPSRCVTDSTYVLECSDGKFNSYELDYLRSFSRAPERIFNIIYDGFIFEHEKLSKGE